MQLAPGVVSEREPAVQAGTLAELMGVTDAVQDGMLCRDVLARFRADSTLSGLLVTTENGQLLGMVSRNRMLEVFSLPYRADVYFNRPIGEIFWRLFPLTTFMRADMGVPEAAELVLRRGQGGFQEPVVVVSQGSRPARIVEAQALLMALVSLQDKQFNDLQSARDSLVRAEKLASLGGLVAGVAHEINTPVGVSLSAASFLVERVNEFAASLGARQLKRSDVEALVTHAREASDLILRNMTRAGALIQSFKRVSADQASEARREFDLAQTLDEVVRSVLPSFKHQPVRVVVDAPPGLMLDSFPGAVGQIVTNLVQNAVLHAFPDERAGVVLITAQSVDPAQVRLEVADDGAGMAPDVLEQAFEPFFTTKRQSGGTGLGLHIVHNLVVNVLGGSLGVASQLGEGTRFTMDFPCRVVRRELPSRRGASGLRKG
jgi:signal transduction histidine kinase